jgi:hypothetical protein
MVPHCVRKDEYMKRRNFLKDSMAGAVGLVVASTTSIALGRESGKKQKSVLATDTHDMEGNALSRKGQL